MANLVTKQMANLVTKQVVKQRKRSGKVERKVNKKTRMPMVKPLLDPEKRGEIGQNLDLAPRQPVRETAGAAANGAADFATGEVTEENTAGDLEGEDPAPRQMVKLHLASKRVFNLCPLIRRPRMTRISMAEEM